MIDDSSSCEDIDHDDSIHDDRDHIHDNDEDSNDVL
jgi:hypothetical protein